jgi:hypothetical protein
MVTGCDLRRGATSCQPPTRPSPPLTPTPPPFLRSRCTQVSFALRCVVCLLTGLVAVLVHTNTFEMIEFVYDDESAILNNHNVRGADIDPDRYDDPDWDTYMDHDFWGRALEDGHSHKSCQISAWYHANIS